MDMRKSLVAAAAAFALIASACGGSATVTTTTTATTSTTAVETTTTALGQPEAQVLSYNLSAGTEYTYDVELAQTIQMTAEGNGAAVSDEEIPGSADIDMTASGTFTYTIDDGPDPGTYAVRITGEFSDVSATGVVDGEPIDSGEVPEFADIAPVDVTVIVDEQGNVIPESSDAADPFTGLFGGLDDLSGIPGSSPGQFFGPPFGDDLVTVGSMWESTYSTPGFGEEEITTTVRAEVTGTENVDGIDVLVIESETQVSPIEFDLAEFFLALFTGFLPEDPTAEEQAEIDALTENLRFAISIDATRSNSTTLFDPASGITHSFEAANSANIGMDVNFPDETTGELSGFVMNMSMDQTISQTLVSAPEA